MSKFVKVMIVLLTIAAFAAPAIAADNFKVSGEHKTLGFYLDDGGDSTDTGVYQRLRVQGTFTANENVSATFRTDFSEGDWGNDTGHGRFQTIDDMDRAYADVKFDAFDLRIGTQYFAFGKTTSVIANDTGIKFTTKGDVPVTVMYSLVEDNGASTDTYLAGINAAFAGFNVFVANQKGGEQDVYELGATYDGDYDAIKVAAELNYFTGDHTEAIDAEGLQFYMDVAFAASETMTVGGELFYAQGSDDEEQYSRLGNAFGTWDPLTRGPYNDEMFQFAGMAYEILGDNAGIMGLQAYADVKASDALAVNASVGYVETEEDDVAEDDALVLNVGGTYMLMANVKAVAHIQYADVDSLDDALLSAGLGLKVNF